MTAIRPLEREDLPEVAALYELVMRSGTRAPRAETVSFFQRALLDHPWADPELPSLVHLDRSGGIVAFIGSHARRLRLREEPLRLACSGHLVADPEAENRVAGALLLARYLKGPQDLTITDGATPTVHRIWDRLGGQPSALGCVGWTRVFRPLQFLGDRRASRRRGRGMRAGARRSLAPLDAIAVRASSRVLLPPRVTSGSEPLTPKGLLEHLATMTTTYHLLPGYDEEFLDWLFSELALVRDRGELVARVVRDAEGQVCGWYVYYLKVGGACPVIQIAARSGLHGAVIDQLFREAQEAGAAALHGRLEPSLLEPLSRRRCILRFTGGALVHSRRDDVLSAIASPGALLTRMEGEWWMGPHLGISPGTGAEPEVPTSSRPSG
jgi:hypothetical protein